MISAKHCCQVVLNYSGVIYTLGSVVMILTVNAYFACPETYGAEQCRGPIAFGYFVLFEVAINFIFIHYKAKYNRVSSLLPDNSRIPYANYKKNAQYEIPYNPSYLPHNNNNINPNSTLIHVQNRSKIDEINDSSQQQQHLPAQQPYQPPTIGSVPTSEYTKYCFTCQMTVPQRCHHCPLCNYCVLKKDHHCFLTGACVGFGNQRYFVVFLFWACVGATYGSIYAARYLNSFFQPMFPLGWIDYIFPLAVKKWIFMQHCSVFQLGMIMVFTFGMAGAGTSLTFFVTQWYFILKGQTMFEHMKKEVVADGSSWKQRVASIFGPYWYLNFLFPMPFKNKLDETFRKIVYDYYVKEL